MIVSQALNEARLNAVVGYLGAAATLAIYDDGGIKLVEIALPSPVGVVSDNLLTLTASVEAMIAATGTAATARVYNSSGDLALDQISVSDLAGDGLLKLSSAVLYEGGYTRLVSGVLG